jgi:hypothetical protein
MYKTSLSRIVDKNACDEGDRSAERFVIELGWETIEEMLE